MTEWTLTEEGMEFLEEYVTRDIGFGVNEIKHNKLFKKVQGDNFTDILDEKVDRKSVYSTKAVSMKQLIRCSSEKRVVWGIKMNLLIGILLYNKDLGITELAGKLGVTKSTVTEHISLLENCGLVKRTDKETHLSDFL
ncbi:MAG: hypothetical protein A7316_09415 [Candidatus Altiarchaeales archaeon WOR_SM1_86-2]|nr:MAG: hypothetical protein A7316_09415 [Candidatus Altiarchaeales archaeon WOR_SM1_86-2]ODS41083.1 MAG: hypothetical protein A7315_07125 [Candidatus Altiarchaeales archaeon WOR_SM1_79]